MKIDLKAMSRKELEKLRVDVEAALEKVSVKEMEEARLAIEKAAAEYGYTVAELTGGKKAKTKKAAAKYRNPDDASQTWSGRGRRPRWINDAEAKGIDLATFAI